MPKTTKPAPTKPATTPAAKPSPAPAAKTVQAAPIYKLTQAGEALAPRDGTARAGAWLILRSHAGKPGGLATAKAEINGASHLGSINGTNLFGWAIKAKLVELT